MRLMNQVAVVTGGAQGIGAAIATRFAAEGAAVMIADIDGEQGTVKAAQIQQAGGDAEFRSCDVSDAAQVAALFETTLAKFRRLDVLVNNAAVVHNARANRHFLELETEMWHRAVAVNLDGLFYCSQHAARILVKQGQGGCILNLSSGGASRAHRHMMAYDTTKGGIEAATRAMALDLAPWQIRVNAIVPGNITVARSIPVGPGGKAIAPSEVIPLGRSGTPEEIAAAALFLASAEASYVTGHCLFVDGGMDAQLRSPGVDAHTDPNLAAKL